MDPVLAVGNAADPLAGVAELSRVQANRGLFTRKRFRASEPLSWKALYRQTLLDTFYQPVALPDFEFGAIDAAGFFDSVLVVICTETVAAQDDSAVSTHACSIVWHG